MKVTFVSLEPTDVQILWPAPSITDTEELWRSVSTTPYIEGMLLKTPYDIVGEYRGATMWIAPNAYFYRCEPGRGGGNQYTAPPHPGDTENVLLNIDGQLYRCQVEFS
jgi:hypothetical protein